MIFPRQLDDKFFYHIARSHMYWGRKDINGLCNIFSETKLKTGDVFLDPFCGGGSAVIAAICQGARVIASDVNPMAAFLTKVLVQPINIFDLQAAFEKVKTSVSEKIQEKYTISCPSCNKITSFDFLKWSRRDGHDSPVDVKVNCSLCGSTRFVPLSNKESNRQLQAVNLQPEFWFPKNKICSRRKIRYTYFHELFTSRNLSSLAELLHTIDTVTWGPHKELLQYVFTSMLYSCSSMQMISKDRPTSRGWTALRFYMPDDRQEKNVWKAFEKRFTTVLNCKKKTNDKLEFVRVSDSLEQFVDSDATVNIREGDFLNLHFPTDLEIDHVFLDPPYKDDIDYLGFSEFWGSWLKMKFNHQTGWNSGVFSDEENVFKFKEILLRIKEMTSSHCNITLAFGDKRGWMQDAVSKAGYHLQELKPILYDHSLKRGTRVGQEERNFSSVGHYFLLSQKKHTRGLQKVLEKNNDDQLKFYFRVAAFFANQIKPEKQVGLQKIRFIASKLMPPNLLTFIKDIIPEVIGGWTSDNVLNRKAYHRYCLDCVALLLCEGEEKYVISSANPSQFDDYDFIEKNNFKLKNLPSPQGLAKLSDFVATKEKRNLIFCFYDCKDKKRETLLKKVAKNIFKKDVGVFQNICFLIVPSTDAMVKYRQVEWADKWQRGFFICFEELVERVRKVKNHAFGHIDLSFLKNNDNPLGKKIEIFDATIVNNDPVGKDGTSQHYKIKFETGALQSVKPGQFVMIDTQQKSLKKEGFPPPALKKLSGSNNILSKSLIKPFAYLKRPFSIHRAFYENFKDGYIKHISLPQELARIAHTVFPDKFDIFYKILDDGVGTNELQALRPGNTIQMIGPLGKGQDLANLEFNEIHLIGGGVGMAPLVFFGQGLKYYSFKIKAFIGIQNVNTLLQDFVDRGLVVSAKNSYVYIDDLENIGLNKSDIHISFEEQEIDKNLKPDLPDENFNQGYVTKQYAAYLKKMNKQELKQVLVISCGPTPMIKALNKITSRFRVQMKVLLEKRMGCGIGVCMSCVCPTIKNKQKDYSRVCVEGPLFDAQGIDWERLELENMVEI